MKKYIALLVLPFLLLAVSRLTYATFTHHEDPKLFLCHCERYQCQTLKVDVNVALSHLKQHKHDYLGACHQEPSVSSTVSLTESPTASPTEEVTPTPTLEETPTATPSSEVTEAPKKADDRPLTNDTTSKPVCQDGNTVSLPANPHVYRAGASATVNWFQTEGDMVNIYYKEVNAASWQHAVRDVKVDNADHFGSVTIGGLDPNLGYTFGLEQHKGCGGGETVVAVIVDGPESRLFQMSYWQWMK